MSTENNPQNTTSINPVANKSDIGGAGRNKFFKTESLGERHMDYFKRVIQSKQKPKDKDKPNTKPQKIIDTGIIDLFVEMKAEYGISIKDAFAIVAENGIPIGNTRHKLEFSLRDIYEAKTLYNKQKKANEKKATNATPYDKKNFTQNTGLNFDSNQIKNDDIKSNQNIQVSVRKSEENSYAIKNISTAQQ